MLNAEPDAWQVEALRAIARGHTRIAIRSGHGVGKSAMAAWTITWFCNTRAPFKCAVTAPSAPQLFDVLVPETRKWFERLPKAWNQLWDMTSDHIRLKSDQECFITFRTSRPETPEAMAGLHSTNILLVADEASGVDEAVYEAAGGSMSSPGAITLLIGNPTRSTGFFWRAHTLERDRWHCMAVSCLDSPRVSRDYIDEMARRYGENSNAWRIRVLGQFPQAEDDTLIPAELVDSAMQRDVPLDEKAPTIWGLDCARYGNDASCLIKRTGYVVTEMPRRWRNTSTMELAGAVKAEFDFQTGNQPKLIVIDSIGIGAGVVDRLHEQGLPVLGINVGEQSSTKERFMRLRDELMWKTREWLATRRVRLPRDDQLRDDLCGPKYAHTSDGKLQVESKEKMRSRGLPSPDCFVAGTTVATPSGPRMIETLCIGELVTTPFGPTEIIAAWAKPATTLTTARFSNGRRLTGTGHHKVFCWGDGIRRLDALSLTDRMEPLTEWRLAAWRVLSSLSIAGRNSEFRPLVDTIRRTGRMSPRGFCTAVCGQTFTALYQTVITSITSMVIGAITPLRTLNWSMESSISGGTSWRRLSSLVRESATPSGWSVQGSQPLSGMDQRKAWHGTASTPLPSGRHGSGVTLYARAAAPRSNLPSAMPNIVRGRAGRRLHGIPGGGSPIAAYARSAVRSLWRTATARRSVVPVSVVTESVKPTAVYNLTLARHNAYYANGILVFNSADALMLTLAEQSIGVTSEGHSGLFDPNPVMDTIPGMEI